MKLKDGTALFGVRDRKTGFPLRHYDDGEGPVWLYGDECGDRIAIRARSFEAAYEIALDESEPIPETELPEAYGFYGPDAREKFEAALERAKAEEGDWPELVDGYQYQNNSSGTGIVDVSDYETLHQLTAEEARERYRLVVCRSDEQPEPVHVVCSDCAYTLTVRGKTKTYKSYALLDDVGARLAKLERAIGTCDVGVRWDRYVV